MNTIPLSIINLRTNKEASLATNQAYINLQPPWQREYEAWDEKIKTRFIETIIIGRTTNPIWTILNPDDESECVLDGMHRLTTSLKYLNNEFELCGKYFTHLGIEFDKKKFEDLDNINKSKIRNYLFIFNLLDATYYTDANKRRDMYEILNRSNQHLNTYEYNKVLYHSFYNIINDFKDCFEALFYNKKDSRGEIQTEIIELVVLTSKMPNSWTSIKGLTDKWYKEELGEKEECVNEYLKKNKTEIGRAHV